MIRTSYSVKNTVLSHGVLQMKKLHELGAHALNHKISHSSLLFRAAHSAFSHNTLSTADVGEDGNVIISL